MTSELMTVWIILTTVLTFVRHGLSTCQCEESKLHHLQTQYCQADFAIRCKVEERSDEPVKHPRTNQLMMKYRVKIFQIYKDTTTSPTKRIRPRMRDVWTPVYPDCQAHFQVGALLLIMGTTRYYSNYYDFDLETTSCYLNPYWYSLTGYTMKQIIYGNFSKTCGDVCNILHCKKEPDAGSCAVPYCCNQIQKYDPLKDCVLINDFPKSNRNMCYDRYSYCRKDHLECSFEHTSDFTSCLHGIAQQSHSMQQEAEERMEVTG